MFIDVNHAKELWKKLLSRMVKVNHDSTIRPHVHISERTVRGWKWGRRQRSSLFTMVLSWWSKMVINAYWWLIERKLDICWAPAFCGSFVGTCGHVWHMTILGRYHVLSTGINWATAWEYTMESSLMVQLYGGRGGYGSIAGPSKSGDPLSWMSWSSWSTVLTVKWLCFGVLLQAMLRFPSPPSGGFGCPQF